MTEILTADPLAAVCAYLQAATGDVFEMRAFRPDLPQSEDQFMPRACIVVRRAGGVSPFGDSYMPITAQRLDIACYGANQQECEMVAQSVVVAMKRLTNSHWENCKLYSANISAGPLPSFEANTLWDMCLVSVQLLFAEDPVN